MANLNKMWQIESEHDGIKRLAMLAAVRIVQRKVQCEDFDP